MNRTLIASALAIAFSMSGSAWAVQNITKTGDGSDTFTDTTTVVPNFGAAANDNSTASQNVGGTASATTAGAAAANNGGTATATLTNAFNTNNVIANSTLSGAVTGVTVLGIGNSPANFGTSVGGAGAAGTGAGGVAASTNTQTSGAATAVNVANSGAASVATGDAAATGGTATSGDTHGMSGYNEATASATAGDGTGTGGAGGAGGHIHVDAGTFDMSNTMSSTGQSAAGIMVASQNSGAASLVQNSVNVQSNLSVGH